MSSNGPLPNRMNFTHKATGLPGGSPETDRTICYDGMTIARTFQIEGGQNDGRWSWLGYWSPAEFGMVDNLETALAAIKSSVSHEKLTSLPPKHRESRLRL